MLNRIWRNRTGKGIMRIYLKNAYIYFMKARLNITIDDSLLNSIKAYAAKKHTSVSELVENYFKRLTQPTNRKTFFDLVEELKKPKIDPHADLKELYYKDQAKKYGF